MVLILAVAIAALVAPQIRCGTAGAPAADLLRGGAESTWAQAPAAAISVNRTPPLYEGDPLDDGARPDVRASLLRDGGEIFVLLRWSDPTDSRPQAPERVADAGNPEIYKEHSRDIERFADAACVMVPQHPESVDAFPSLMMGEPAQPVDLYYWNRARGFERLVAAGRGTTTRTGQAFPGSARRIEGGWECVFEMPAVPAGTPVAFAIWDGDRQQRDGLKYFSVWYEISP